MIITRGFREAQPVEGSAPAGIGSLAIRMNSSAMARAIQMSRAVLLLLAAATLGGCRHAVLGNPAFIGASATAGIGAETKCDGEADALPVDLAVVYAAVVTAKHAEPIRCADALFYRAPVEAAAAQCRTIAEAEPSVVIALDWLFWAAYAPTAEAAEEAPRSAAQVRSDRITQALAELDAMSQLRPPPTIVLGDLPDFARSPTSKSRPVEAIGAAEVAELNAAIRAWAGARPHVVLVEVSEWSQGSARADGTPLMQSDGLHPTAEGLVFVMQRICEALEGRGLIQPSDWRRSDPLDQALVAAAARASMKSGSAGWLDKASMYLAYRSLNEEIERKPPDCAAIERQVARLLDPAPELDADPTGSGFGATMALMSVASAAQLCPDVVDSLRQCLDRLAFDVRRVRPNPFRLELWIDISRHLDRDEEVRERLGVLCRDLGCEWGPYAATLESECRFLRTTSAKAQREMAERRAAVVAMIGGPVATRERGVKMLEGIAAQGETSGAVAPSASMALTIPVEPVATEHKKSDFNRALQVQRVLELVLDLRAAASIGVPEADHAADELLASLVSTAGVHACRLAVDFDPALCSSPFLPNGGVAMRGYCEPADRLKWGIYGSDDALTVSLRSNSTEVRQVTPEGGSSSGPAAAESPKHAPSQQIEVGLIGRFGAPDGTFTLVDDASIVTSVAADGTTLRSRALDHNDHRVLAARPRAALGEARPLAACDDLPKLWRAIWDEAQSAGCDAIFPYGIRVDGAFEQIVVRVERGSPDPQAPNHAASGLEVLFGRTLPKPADPLVLEIPTTRATIVGVVAPASVTRCVRPGAPMRLHAVWTDAMGARHTGEVIALRGASELAMSVACDPRK